MTKEELEAIAENRISDKNCPVTMDHVNIAKDIFGKDVATMKGKSTRPKSPRVVEDYIEIPDEFKSQQQNIVLCIDIMYVNGLCMLTTIDKNIWFRALVPLNNRELEELYREIDVVLHKYNGSGYQVAKINCDREFKKVINVVKDEWKVKMNYTGTDEHMPEAERNNRTIAEWIRVAYH